MLKVETREPERRFFEDFQEGQELPTVTQGPMMVGDQVRWAGACDNYESEFHHDEYMARAQALPGILLSMDQVFADPQVRASGLVQSVTHPRLGTLALLGAPLTFSAGAPRIERPAPEKGEHTDALLREAGYGEAEVAALRRSGAAT